MVGTTAERLVNEIAEAALDAVRRRLVLCFADIGTAKRAFRSAVALQILAMAWAIAAVCALPRIGIHRFPWCLYLRSRTLVDVVVRNDSRRGYVDIRRWQMQTDSGMLSTCCRWREHSSG
jgi:hypothetical protein